MSHNKGQRSKNDKYQTGIICYLLDGKQHFTKWRNLINATATRERLYISAKARYPGILHINFYNPDGRFDYQYKYPAAAPLPNPGPAPVRGLRK